MSLTPGQRIGAYEVVAPLGAGGMGEVYRARDTTLERDVALKILPDLFASDPERLARFQREAKTLASLNHPHIAQIHGLETSSGVRALVMELVDGEDLAQRIARGPLPIDEALAIAKQIAEALEAAHEAGIVHRDLKPANIKLRSDGTVKVLDFGLAKAAASAGLDVANSPTFIAATQLGVIVGTAAYMAPEQARGKAVDKRADIWAFGCVLYEMLTGRRAFGGETVTDILAAVVEREPDWTKLPPSTPIAIERLLRRCLHKTAKLRLRDIGDVRLELEESDSGALVPVASPRPSPRVFSRHERMFWVAVAALLALSIGALLLRARVPAATPQLLRAAIPTPEGVGVAFTRGIALSPDGEWLTFTAVAPDGRHALWLRRLNEAEARPLQGTDDGGYPFWSADGSSIGFFADRKLKRIARDGGLPQTLCDAPFGRGGTWNANGVIVFAPGHAGGGSLYRVASAGGECAPITNVDASRGESFHSAPHFLPDGTHFLFVARGQGPWSLRLGSLESGDAPSALLSGPMTRAEYASGYLFFDREGILLAQRFDAGARVLSGEPVAIASVARPRAWATFSASGGRVALWSGRSSQDSQLTWVDRHDRVLGVVPGGKNFWTFRLSGDGDRVVSNNGYGGLSLGEVDRGTSVVLTSGTRNATPDLNPVWSPDGGRVAFQRVRSNDAIYEKIIGGGEEGPLVKVGEASWPTDWSSDGRFVLFTRRAAGSTDIWVYSVKEKKMSPVVTTAGNDDFGSFSPDARWIAYVSDETGAAEIQIRPFPNPGSARRVSTAGGTWPKWRADGRELYYVAPGGAVMAVAIQPGGELRLGAPALLFRRALVESAPYDVATSGAEVRFLLNLTLGRPDPLQLILGWQRLVEQHRP